MIRPKLIIYPNSRLKYVLCNPVASNNVFSYHPYSVRTYFPSISLQVPPAASTIRLAQQPSTMTKPIRDIIMLTTPEPSLIYSTTTTCSISTGHDPCDFSVVTNSKTSTPSTTVTVHNMNSTSPQSQSLPDEAFMAITSNYLWTNEATKAPQLPTQPNCNTPSQAATTGLSYRQAT